MWVGALAAVAVAACAAAFAVRAVEFRGAAKPGVHLLGEDVGGKSREGLEALVRRWGARQVTIRAGGHSYHVPRSWLVTLDARKTATRALAAGSTFALAVPRRVDVAPVVAPSGGADNVLGQIARVGRPPVSATVTVHGTTVSTTPAEDGDTLDRKSLLRELAGGATSLDAPFTAVHPPRRDPAARSAASTAEALLAKPIAIDYHGARLGAVTPLQLGACASHRSRASIGSRSVRRRHARAVRFVRGSVAGSSTRTTRSSPSAATACTSFPRATAGTSTRCRSQLR